MKFAHLADIHLGAWREPKLRELGTKAFVMAIDRCISEGVDFVLISGDLFNTSLPPIESLKVAVTQLKRLKDAGVAVYTIAGSHDFSPSGKTMLEVLEEAELVVDVFKGDVVDERLRLRFAVDAKTGAKITGMIGKKGMLEKRFYEGLVRENLEGESGFKVFMFHTALSELKPRYLEKMESAPISLLPKGFDYYAGGHVHIVEDKSLEGYKNVVYPGPTFPNSFSELEKLGRGGFYLYDSGDISYVKLHVCSVVALSVDCEGKNPSQVNEMILSSLQLKDMSGALVLLRLHGKLETGKISEIGMRKMTDVLVEKGAYLFMKNTSRLTSRGFDEVKVRADSTDEAEKIVIDEHLGQVKSLGLSAEAEKELIQKLMSVLDVEKEEGEKQADYDARMVGELVKVFEKE
ncbi:DNA repair exonuclease [Nanoarchaeota archaeon]